MAEKHQEFYILKEVRACAEESDGILLKSSGGHVSVCIMFSSNPTLIQIGSLSLMSLFW